MSFARRQRRAKRVPILTAKPTASIALAERRYRDELEAAQGEFFLYVLAFLRCKHGYGRKRLQRFVDELNDFVMSLAGTTKSDILNMIKHECKLDLAAYCEEAKKAEITPDVLTYEQYKAMEAAG